MIRWFEKNRFASIIMVVLITIEIFYFSNLSFTGVGGGNIWISRIYHFTIFFLFSFFFFITIKGNQKLKTSHILIALFISVTHAFLDEFHQSLIPHRDSSINDVLTNTIGIFTSMILYLYASIKSYNKNL